MNAVESTAVYHEGKVEGEILTRGSLAVEARRRIDGVRGKVTGPESFDAAIVHVCTVTTRMHHSSAFPHGVHDPTRITLVINTRDNAVKRVIQPPPRSVSPDRQQLAIPRRTPSSTYGKQDKTTDLPSVVSCKFRSTLGVWFEASSQDRGDGVKPD